MKIMDKMKKILIALLCVAPFVGMTQKYETFAVVNIDSALTANSGDYELITIVPDSAGQYFYKNMGNPVELLDGVNLRYLQSIIDTLTTAAGTDSLVFEGETGRLFDYRNGSIYYTTYIQYGDFTLLNGATRTITIEAADAGSSGNDLIIKAGDNDDGINGGDLYLKGGGEIDEFGDVHIGASDVNSKVYIYDSLYLDTVRIRGVAPGIDSSDAVNLYQIRDLKKYVYTISLPAGSGISDRLTGAYTAPTGWTLTAGSNDIDLEIEHNTGRRVVDCSVFSNLSGVEQLLVNSAGYTSIVTPDSNNVTIGSLATQIIVPLKVYLILE